MIKLNLPRDPQWIVLPHGVQALVRPLDTAVDAAARAEASAELREKKEASPAASDEFWRLGRAKAALARALGQFAVIEWRGVLDSGGNPALVTADAVASLMNIPEIATEFLRKIYEPLERLAVEGEDYGVAQNGGSATAPHIARDVGAAASTAAINVGP
ncbi:Tail assembly chaperone [Azospirillaceae bacterium]